MSNALINYDVAIVGSGPAGSSAAYKLSQNGLNVLLIEKSSHPRYKACGGGVVQRTLKYIPINVSDAIERYFNAELNQKILSELSIARKLMNLVIINPFLRRNIFRLYEHKLTKFMTQIFLCKETYKEIVKYPLNYLKLLRFWNPKNKV